MIKRDKVDGSAFRQVLTALIISDNFLAEFSEKYNESFFVAKFAGRIAKWCLDFYKQYEEAPKVHIQDIFDEAVRTSDIDKEELQLIEDLLLSLNDDYSNNDLNVKFLMKKVSELKDKQDFESFKNELSEAVSNKDIEYAKSLVKEFQVLEDDSEEIDYKPDQPLKDQETVDAIFSIAREPLLQYPGALGNLINKGMTRKGVMIIRAQSGTGKTNMIKDIVTRACMNRLNIAEFQVGDLTKGQGEGRMFMNMSRLSLKPLKEDHWFPMVDCIQNQDDSCPLADRESCGRSILNEYKQVDYSKVPKGYKPCSRCNIKNIPYQATIFKQPFFTDSTLDKEAVKKWQKIFSSRMRGRKLFTKTFALGTCNIDMINKILLRWKKEYNFNPDIIAIDYLGILKKEPNSSKEERLIIDERYQATMRLAQEFNALVVSGEQKKSEAYSGKVRGMSSFYGSSTVNNHVSFGIEITQSKEDKRNKCIRINTYKDRYNEYDEDKEVMVLQDLNRGAFCLDSYDIPWIEPVEEPEKKKFYKKKY